MRLSLLRFCDLRRVRRKTGPFPHFLSYSIAADDGILIPRLLASQPLCRPPCHPHLFHRERISLQTYSISSHPTPKSVRCFVVVHGGKTKWRDKMIKASFHGIHSSHLLDPCSQILTGDWRCMRTSCTTGYQSFCKYSTAIREQTWEKETRT